MEEIKKTRKYKEFMTKEAARESEREGEVRNVKPVRVPKKPTEAEVKERDPLHIEYRECCNDCVEGRARDCATSCAWIGRSSRIKTRRMRIIKFL